MFDADPILASRVAEARAAYDEPVPSPSPWSGSSYGDVPVAVQLARAIAGIQATIAIIGLVIVFFLAMTFAADIGFLVFVLLLFLVGAGLVVPSALLACAIALRHLEKWVRASMITIECLILLIAVIGVFTDLLPLFVPVLLSAIAVLVCLGMPSSIAAFNEAEDDDAEWGPGDGWDPGGARMGTANAYASEDDVLGPQPGELRWGDLFSYWRRGRRD